MILCQGWEGGRVAILKCKRARGVCGAASPARGGAEGAIAMDRRQARLLNSLNYSNSPCECVAAQPNPVTLLGGILMQRHSCLV